MVGMFLNDTMGCGWVAKCINMQERRLFGLLSNVQLPSPMTAHSQNFHHSFRMRSWFKASKLFFWKMPVSLGICVSTRNIYECASFVVDLANQVLDYMSKHTISIIYIHNIHGLQKGQVWLLSGGNRCDLGSCCGFVLRSSYRGVIYVSWWLTVDGKKSG